MPSARECHVFQNVWSKRKSHEYYTTITIFWRGAGAKKRAAPLGLCPDPLLRWNFFCNWRRRGLVDNLPAEQRHLALQILEVSGRHRVHVAIPNRDVGFLAHFDGADLII